MSSDRGWFESDEAYQRRKELENREILKATGRDETWHVFESEKERRNRLAAEVNQEALKAERKSEITRGIFENNKDYRNRIRQELLYNVRNPSESKEDDSSVNEDDDNNNNDDNYCYYDDDNHYSQKSLSVTGTVIYSSPRSMSSAPQKPKEQDHYEHYLDILKDTDKESLLSILKKDGYYFVNFQRVALSKIEDDFTLQALYWEIREKRDLGHQRLSVLSPEEVLARISNRSILSAIEQREDQKRREAVEAMDRDQLIRVACYHRNRLLCMESLRTLCYREEYDALPCILA
ncbi:MAG TPA: hypothetical protein PK412_02170, partial [bacterium]|nr:hypothetical protein [bacterium]